MEATVTCLAMSPSEWRDAPLHSKPRATPPSRGAAWLERQSSASRVFPIGEKSAAPAQVQ